MILIHRAGMTEAVMRGAYCWLRAHTEFKEQLHGNKREGEDWRDMDGEKKLVGEINHNLFIKPGR